MFKKLLFLLLSFPLFLFSKNLSLVTLQYPPYQYEENGIAKGINVDIVKEAFKRMDFNVTIKFFPWKRALVMVKNGYADGIIDAAYSKERATFMHYPKTEINIEQWYAFKKKGSPLTLDKDFANSKDIRLGITRGFVYGGNIQELIDSNKFKEIQEVSINELNTTKLIANRFDMFIGVKVITMYLARKHNQINEIEIVKKTNTNEDFLLNTSNTYLAFSKKTVSKEFSNSFSKVLDEMKKDKTIKKITNRYLSTINHIK